MADGNPEGTNVSMRAHLHKVLTEMKKSKSCWKSRRNYIKLKLFHAFSCSQKSYKQKTSNDRNRWCRLLIMRISDIIPSLFLNICLMMVVIVIIQFSFPLLNRLVLLPSIKKKKGLFHAHKRLISLQVLLCVLKKSWIFYLNLGAKWEQKQKS